MRKEIWRILKDLENEKATTNEAYHLLCDLFDVGGRSELLKNHPFCGTCTDFKIVGKAFVCKKCGKEHKSIFA